MRTGAACGAVGLDSRETAGHRKQPFEATFGGETEKARDKAGTERQSQPSSTVRKKAQPEEIKKKKNKKEKFRESFSLNFNIKRILSEIANRID